MAKLLVKVTRPMAPGKAESLRALLAESLGVAPDDLIFLPEGVDVCELPVCCQLPAVKATTWSVKE